jgi:hypothetical protein
LISSTGIIAEYNPEIPIDGLFRCASCTYTWEAEPTRDFPVTCPKCNEVKGGPRFYRPDALVDGWFVVEVEGEGSASKSNEQREAYLISKRMTTLHIPNDCVRRHPEVISQVVAIVCELKRKVIGGGGS